MFKNGFFKISAVLFLIFINTGAVHSNTQTLKHSNTPVRIVSLKPNITELLFAIGAGKHLVGVTTWCNRPEEARKLPKVADYISANVEKVLALKPDMVVSSEENSMKEPIKAIQNAGIPVLLLPFKRIDDFLESTKKLATATGHDSEGKALINSIVKQLATSNEQRVKALVIVGKRPLVAAGPNTYIGELLTIVGGKNIITGKTPYPHINIETVISGDPDVIIDLSMGSEAGPADGIPDHWKGQRIRAVADGRVYTKNISDFRVGPGLVEQIRMLNNILYPLH